MTAYNQILSIYTIVVPSNYNGTENLLSNDIIAVILLYNILLTCLYASLIKPIVFPAIEEYSSCMCTYVYMYTIQYLIMIINDYFSFHLLSCKF